MLTTAEIPIVVAQHTAPQGAPIFDRGTPAGPYTKPPPAAPRPHPRKTTPSTFTKTTTDQWIDHVHRHEPAPIGNLLDSYGEAPTDPKHTAPHAREDSMNMSLAPPVQFAGNGTRHAQTQML